LKITAARQQVLRVFQDMPASHLSADAVYRIMFERGARANLATVYRSLSCLEKAGLLRHARYESGKAFYELNDGRQHSHMVCTRCGKVQEFHNARIAELHQAIARELGFEVLDEAYELQVRCVSGDCKKH
jgi:Fur family ferric uptake transcriptional regulator